MTSDNSKKVINKKEIKRLIKNERHKEYYRKNKERILEKQKEYEKVHKDRRNELRRERRKNNPEKYRQKDKIYRENHKEIVKKLRNKYYKNNHEEILKRKSKYCKLNRKKISEREKIYKDKNREKIRKQMSELNKKKRLILFGILGGAECIKCKEKDVRVLVFDHINGGGRQDIKRFKNNSSMYYYYIKNPEEAKKTLQVLCQNCNMIKKYELNETANKEYMKRVKK